MSSVKIAEGNYLEKIEILIFYQLQTKINNKLKFEE